MLNPQALSRCCLKHCVALWQLLTSLKSETMLRLKRVPESLYNWCCELQFYK